MNLPERLSVYCVKKKQLSGYEFGQLTGLSQQQISRYERGRNHLTLNLLIKMLIVLDVTLEDFFLPAQHPVWFCGYQGYAVRVRQAEYCD
ncbi:helix-turn-helix domain-containing protein [Morganella psychrotolerans]|uniref:helix-turn-helix domain-containing protein n=1 Tax=Morganella psychrotolerans TaxID=368603 RepID=UPI0009EDAC80